MSNRGSGRLKSADDEDTEASSSLWPPTRRGSTRAALAHGSSDEPLPSLTPPSHSSHNNWKYSSTKSNSRKKKLHGTTARPHQRDTSGNANGESKRTRTESNDRMVASSPPRSSNSRRYINKNNVEEDSQSNKPPAQADESRRASRGPPQALSHDDGSSQAATNASILGAAQIKDHVWGDEACRPWEQADAMEQGRVSNQDAATATSSSGIVHVTVNKRTRDTKTGIKVSFSKGAIRISHLSRFGLFQDTALKVGQELVSINGIACQGCHPKECYERIKNGVGDITIVAHEAHCPLELVRVDHSTEFTTGASNVGNIERGARPRTCEEQEQAPGVEEAANVAAKKSGDADTAEDCFSAEGGDSAFMAHAAEAFPFENGSQAARSDAREEGQAVEVVKKSLGTYAILDRGVEANQHGEETLSQVPSTPLSCLPQQEEVSLVMEEAKEEEEEELDMYDVRVLENRQAQGTSTPPSEQTTGRENVSNPGAFAVQGQTIEQRTLGMVSPIDEPEHQTGLPSVIDNPIPSPMDDSTSQIPIAATVASDQVETEVNARLRRTLAQTPVAETVPVADRKWWKQPAVLAIAVFLLVATIVGVTVGLLLSPNDPDSPSARGGYSCDTSVSLKTDGTRTFGSTIGASFDNVVDCGMTTNTESGVWYKVVGTGNPLAATTCFDGLDTNLDLDFDFDTQISVYSGTCANLVCIDGNDDSSCGSQSSVTWESVSREEYFILVHGSLGTGDFALSVGAGITCKSAVGPLPVDGSVTIGSNANGTMAYDGSTSCGTAISSLGVWYRVIGTGGTMSASTCADTTDFDTRLSIYSGTCDSLVCVGGNDFDKCGTSWNSIEGDQYFILVHGSNDGDLGATGMFGLTVTIPLPDGTWLQLGQDLDGDEANDYFGRSVSLSNDATVLAAGAPYNNANSYDAGHVRVFRRDSAQSTWSQMGQKLKGGAAEDYFGTSVSLNGAGDILAVGANQYGNDGPGYTQAFQYDASTDTWRPLAQKLDGSAAYDHFGYSVSLSNDGTTLAVGGYGYSNYRGHVRIFEYDSSSERWSQLGNDLEGQAAGDQFGVSVSLNGAGDIVGVGADDADTRNGWNSGRVQVFQYSSSADEWRPLGSDLDGAAAGDGFGRFVSLSNHGMVLGAGARLNGENGSNAGQVRVFQYSSSELAWLQLGNPLNGEADYDYFGESVSLNGAGNVVAAGARYNDNANGSSSGHVRVFQYDTTEAIWTQVGGDIDGEAADDYSGTSVSLSDSGSEVAIGAPENSDNGEWSGHVRVYALDPN